MVASAQSTILPFIHTLPVPLKAIRNSSKVRGASTLRAPLRQERTGGARSPKVILPVRFIDFHHKTGSVRRARVAVYDNSNKNGRIPRRAYELAQLQDAGRLA